MRNVRIWWFERFDCSTILGVFSRKQFAELTDRVIEYTQLSHLLETIQAIQLINWITYLHIGKFSICNSDSEINSQDISDIRWRFADFGGEFLFKHPEQLIWYGNWQRKFFYPCIHPSTNEMKAGSNHVSIYNSPEKFVPLPNVSHISLGYCQFITD